MIFGWKMKWTQLLSSGYSNYSGYAILGWIFNFDSLDKSFAKNETERFSSKMKKVNTTIEFSKFELL